MPEKEQNIHATCVFFGDAEPVSAVLLRGPSGSGKSDLALRLIAQGARLVADDQVWLKARAGVLYARPPAETAGMIEVRGVGIVNFEPFYDAPVRLVADLVQHENVERLPEKAYHVVQGVRLRRIALCAFDASAPVKLRLALEQALSEK